MNEDQNIPGEKSGNENLPVNESTEESMPENVTEPIPPPQITTAIEQSPGTNPNETPHINPETLNDKLQTEEMESHHSHHIHHSKKWKDYLFEFLMLFLAVTAGFFMENKRESYVEHQREKQYVELLLADLRLDSIEFAQKKKDIQAVEKRNDALVYLLTEKKNATDKEIMEILLPATFAFNILATSTTYSQMKASGSLRYIENLHLTGELQKYYDVLLPRCIEFAQTSLIYLSQNITPFYLEHMRTQDYDSFEDTLINKNPAVMNRTPQTDQELANIMGKYRDLLKIQAISMNKPAFEKIKELIVLLKKEYDLQ